MVSHVSTASDHQSHKVTVLSTFLLLKIRRGDFPGGPVVRAPSSQGELGSIPGRGIESHKSQFKNPLRCNWDLHSLIN